MDVGVRRSGGCRPPRVTVDMKPDFCRDSASARFCFVEGMDVMPSRALEAFCRCEQTLARLTRDMVGCEV